MKQVQKGFTLIELMIVVAIIGILAAVAIPAYQDYITKAKLSKVNTAADALKTAIVEFNQNEGGVANLTLDNWTSLGLAGAPTTTAEVTGYSVAATTGAITLTLAAISGGITAGTTVTLTPTFGNTAVTWAATCGGGGAADPVLKKVVGC